MEINIPQDGKAHQVSLTVTLSFFLLLLGLDLSCSKRVLG